MSEKVKEQDQETTASRCPRCNVKTVREKTRERKPNSCFRMIRGVMYEMDEVVCPYCNLYYLDAWAEKSDENGCEAHSCATCGTLEPDEHCTDCTHYPSRSCHWTPKE